MDVRYYCWRKTQNYGHLDPSSSSSSNDKPVGELAIDTCDHNLGGGGGGWVSARSPGCCAYRESG